MKNPVNLLRLALCLAALSVANYACAKDIVIGQSGPFSGTLGPTGINMSLGIKIYLDSVNDQGGINGKKLVLLKKDDAYKVPETVKNIKELVANDDVIALIGSAGSAHLAAVLKEKILSEGGIAMMSPYTGSPGLRVPFENTKNIFHIRAGYPEEAEGIVDQLMALRTDKIAVFHQGDAFGQFGVDGVTAALKKCGKTIVAEGSYTANCTPVDDCVKEAVKKIAAADPSAVVSWATTPYAASFVKQIRPISRIAQFMNVSVVIPSQLCTSAGPKMCRGVGIAQVMPYPYSSVLPIVKEYRTALKKFGGGVSEDYTSLEEFIGAKVLVEAIRRAGANPTRAGVYKALESMSTFDTGGFLVHFSPTNHAQSNFVEITVISKDGKLVR